MLREEWSGIPNLALNMLNRGIVSYVSQFKAEATAAHNAGKKFFLGETNSGGPLAIIADLFVRLARNVD